jgi:crotonobetainyl-CoA:carnitine CoA-transferase CaiB-like acyl-CoA transferase
VDEGRRRDRRQRGLKNGAPMMPLAGVRVLDLSNVLAGPFCGYHLARLGAEVLKIENPQGGDLGRRVGADAEMNARGMGLLFVSMNAGKQSVALDLKQPAGKEVFLRLVDEADVVLENFRPRVMERLGLGYEKLAKRNPRLVYCAISGFGESGPWAGRPAYDQIVQGLSGAMSVTGDGHSGPLRAGFPVGDTVGGVTAAFAIAAALVEQRTTGKGRFIDVSMLESTISAMGWIVANWLNGGVDPQRLGNENFTAAPSGAFRTGDGLLNIAANEQKQFEALCDVIGRPALKTDPRFAERHARPARREVLREAIEEALAARPAAEWEALLNKAGVPAGRVLSVPEALAAPQIAERGFVEEHPMRNTAGATLRVTRPGFRLDEEFPPPEPARELGADTRRWLARLGYDEAAIAALAREGAVKLGPR